MSPVPAPIFTQHLIIFGRGKAPEKISTCPDPDSNPGHPVARPDALTTEPGQHFEGWCYVISPANIADKTDAHIINTHRLRNEDISSQTHLKDPAESADNLKKKWAGHVMRLNTNRWTYILTTWDPRIGKHNTGRQKTSIVMHLESYDSLRNPVTQTSYNAWGAHRANHTIPPFWLDDRPPLLRHVAVKPGAGWSVLALRGL
ncbi:hypothetical protein ANN_00756 [Periplaneta americana]|uniref:Uncharacterized protein n=1 Tax=Periplaneta americana TaxID=6978 RepID=A0ABQ8TU35_PERAM|nr:hypothetical protein ANN_00756 [Periplaneta americana]